jgi:hypothetical protein
MIDVGLPKELLQLGLVLGLLRRERPEDPESLTVNTAFFEDPGGTLSDFVHDAARREAALDLAAQLLGEARRTLDLPATAKGETWVPLAQSEKGGLYTVVDVTDDGVRLAVAGRGSLAEDGISVAAAITLPIAIVSRTGATRLLAGTAEGPIRIGASLELPAEPGDAEVALSGLALLAELPTAPATEPSLRIQLTGLRLPAWSEPRDLTLSEDLEEVGRELLEVVHGLLQTRSTLGDDASARLRALLALLGLSERPGIPPLPLGEIATRGPGALVDWLRRLAAPSAGGAQQEAPLRAWLETLAELLDLTLPDGVKGSGAIGDPLRFCVRPAPGTELCLRVTVEPLDGAIRITPGVSASLELGSAALPASLRAEVDVLAATLAATPQIVWLPRTVLHARLGSAAAPLLRRPALPAAPDVQVAVLRAGLASGADHRPVLVVAADDVILAGRNYPSLDLSSVEALTHAASTAATDALADALAQLLDEGGGDRRARALLALLGLRAPAAITGTWPVALPAVTDTVTDPPGALARYHARVLAAGLGGTMARELAALMRAPTPSGTGTAADPWGLAPAPAPGTIGVPPIDRQLLVWRTEDLTGQVLHVGVRLSAEPLPLSAGAAGQPDQALRLAVTLDLARLTLPGGPPGGETAGSVLTILSRAEFAVGVGDDVSLDGGSVRVDVHQVLAAVAWERVSGWNGSVVAKGARVTVAGTAVALPDPFALAPGKLPPLPAPASDMWGALAHLLGQAAVPRPDAIRTQLSPRTLAVGLLGWLPSLGPVGLRPHGDEEPPLDLDDLVADGWPSLSIRDLVEDPVAAVRDWAAALFRDSGTDLSLAAVGLLHAVLGHEVQDTAVLASDGEGTYRSPWRLPLGEDGGDGETGVEAPVGLLAWLDPDGPTLAGLGETLSVLTPDDVEAAAEGTGPMPGYERLVEAMAAAARFDPDLDSLLRGRTDLAGALRRLRDLVVWTDGLLPASAQVTAGDTVAPNPLAASHLEAPAAFVLGDALPGSDPTRVIHVSAALPGVSPWPGQPDAPGARLVDLTAPTLPPEAFDVSRLAVTGPWYVMLPARAAVPDGTNGLIARLRRVVLAVTERSGRVPVLVAHSIAAHPARSVWAEGVVSSLVTVAAPAAVNPPALAATSVIDGLDRPEVADAVRLLQALVGRFSVAAAGGAGLRPLRRLLATLGPALGDALSDVSGTPTVRAFPRDDLVPPPRPSARAGSTPPVAVVALLGPAGVDEALATLVRAVTRQVRDGLPGGHAPGTERAAPTHLGVGVGVTLASRPDGSPGQVRLRTRLRADLHRLRLGPDDGDDAAPRHVPRLHVTSVLGRDGGWLVGGPGQVGDGATQTARVRLVEFRVVFDAGTGGLGVSVILHETGWNGLNERRRVVTGASLDGAARGLLREVARSLSSPPAAGPVRDLLDLLTALGVTRVDTVTGGVDIDADVLERILVDAEGFLGAPTGASARGGPLLRLLRLSGATAAGSLPGPVGSQLRLHLDPGARRATLETADAGLSLGAARLDGRMAADANGRVTAELRLTGGGEPGPLGTAALVLTADLTPGSAPSSAWAVRLQLPGGPDGGIPLAPVAATGALGEELLAAVAAELARLALEHVRDVGLDLDPLLSAVGLLRPGDDGEPARVRSLRALLADPGRWLVSPDVLGTADGDGRLAPGRLMRLVEAVGSLLGVTGGAGRLPLPAGGEVAIDEDGPDLLMTLKFRAHAPDVRHGVQSDADAALVVRVAPGPMATTAVKAAVRRTGTTGLAAAALELEAGASTRLTAHLTPLGAGAAELTLPLYPRGPGLGALGALATGAVEQALPALLDALADTAQAADPLRAKVAAALRALGTALGLVSSDRFSIDELRRLAADPPGELVVRLRRNPTAAIAALRAVVQASTGSALPPAPVLWRSPQGAVELGLDATPTEPLAVTLAVHGVQPIDGVSVDLAVMLTGAGLGPSRLAVVVFDPDALLPGPVDLLPFVEVRLGDGTAGADGIEAGIWLDPASAAERQALLVSVPFGGRPAVLRRRVTAAGSNDSADLIPAVPAIVRRIAVPLAADFVLGQTDVAALLDRTVGTERIGGIFVAAGVLEEGPWRLAAGFFEHLTVRAIRAAAGILQAVAAPEIGPFRVRLRTLSGGPVPPGSVRYGLGIRLTEPIEPPPVGALVFAIDADSDWDPPLPDPGEDHVELWVVEVPEDPFAAGAAVQPSPAVQVRGLGFSVRAEQGPLLEGGVRLRALRLHAAYARDAAGAGHAGLRLVAEGLGLDLGAAGGRGNPVAGKVLSPGPGEGEEAAAVAPSFDPELQLFARGGGPASVTLRVGVGEGPWWVPVERSFGPVYIAQVGLDVETAGGRPIEVRLLLDGGASLGGLAVGVDDLALVVPWATAPNPLTWGVDLAGLAVAFDNGGVTLAGGLRKLSRAGGVEYIGMLVLRAAGYGVDVVGSWGEFPVPGTKERYTSLFVFGALSAPLGGPPAFFVTGIGAGVGVNRGLVVPQDMNAVEGFPLVAAMSPVSSLARDPMGALEELARAFPPVRGAFWLAAGVRFTSFTVVESVAVLAVSIGNGVEVTILGRSRMGLPNPAAPLVMIELLLKARFSSREAMLSVQAQLTSNSWLINPACRITGGFAFVIWFRTGEMLLTLGGYHPRFDRPERFPLVPRLGLSWQVSSAVVVKGESYLAITPTAVMTGMRIQVGFNGGFVQATFTAGVDAIVSWDPAYYDVVVFVNVSARLQIEIDLWFLGTIRIAIGFEVGAEVHIWGPRLRGEAVLQLDLARFVVPFGAREPATGAEALGWSAFHDKYLVAGASSGEVLDLSVRSGAHVPDPGGPTGPPDDGTAARPFRLQPEFALAAETRMAANRVNGQDFTGLPLDVVPMKVERVVSSLTVRIFAQGSGAEVSVGRRPLVTPVIGSVPDGLWRLPEPADMGADGMHEAFMGAVLRAVLTLAGDVATGDVHDVQAGPRRELPLQDDRDPGQSLSAAMAAAELWAAAVKGEAALDVAADSLAAAALPRLVQNALARCLGPATARKAAAGPSRFALSTLAADRVAPPRLARITTGVVAPISAPVPVKAHPAPEPAGPTEPGAPRLAALLWPEPARRPLLPGRTTVGAWGRRYARRPAPTMREALAGIAPLAAHVHIMAPPLGTVAGPAGDAPRGRDPVSRFHRAATRREWRRELLADRQPLQRMETDLHDGAAVNLPAGQVQVWHIPRAGADRRPGRPTVHIDGDQTVRVVALGRTGRALADVELAAGTVTVPTGTQRIALVGTGAPPPGGRPPQRELSGWHDGSVLPRIASCSCLVPGGLLRADAAPTVRGRTPVDAALVRGGEAVQAAGVVRTDLPTDTRCVLLVVDVAGAVPPERGLLLGLDGADRPAGATGEPVPPLAVTVGARAWLFFDVTPNGAGAPVTVTVGRDRGVWGVAGVLGAARPAAATAAAVERSGLDALAGVLVERGPRRSTLRWTEGMP